MSKWWLLIPASLMLGLMWKQRKEESEGEYEYDEILSLAGLQPPRWFPKKEGEEERKPRLPASIVTKDIGSFHLELSKSKTAGCTIKLQENLPGWKRKTIGTWTGEPAVCEVKFQQVADVIKTIRFKRKMGK